MAALRAQSHQRMHRAGFVRQHPEAHHSAHRNVQWRVRPGLSPRLVHGLAAALVGKRGHPLGFSATAMLSRRVENAPQPFT